jgi:hypothetical protein
LGVRRAWPLLEKLAGIRENSAKMVSGTGWISLTIFHREPMMISEFIFPNFPGR